MRPDLIVRAMLCALVVVGSTISGCGGGDPAQPSSKPTDMAPPGEPSPEPPSIASPKASVRFLDAPRLSKTFAKVLGLPEAELCKELGQFDCVGFIHKISLLGTDPYLFGVNDPLPATTTSTPLVVERVATAGCVTRVRIDRGPERAKARENHALFDRLAIDATGKLDPATASVASTIDLLYVRALQRHPSAEETTALRELYPAIEALGTPRPAEDWAVASCVAVLTSMEALFY